MYAEIDEVIDNIVASLRMEGLELDAETAADMYKVDRGEMTNEDAIQQIILRATVEKAN